MEHTNSLYFEHQGTKYSATVKEDIFTDPKILLISPNELDDLGKDIKFQLTGTEWIGPESLKNEFPETYNSLLKAISVSNYLP
jgi:hypothetical protein